MSIKMTSVGNINDRKPELLEYLYVDVRNTYVSVPVRIRQYVKQGMKKPSFW